MPSVLTPKCLPILRMTVAPSMPDSKTHLSNRWSPQNLWHKCTNKEFSLFRLWSRFQQNFFVAKSWKVEIQCKELNKQSITSIRGRLDSRMVWECPKLELQHHLTEEQCSLSENKLKRINNNGPIKAFEQDVILFARGVSRVDSLLESLTIWVSLFESRY